MKKLIFGLFYFLALSLVFAKGTKDTVPPKISGNGLAEETHKGSAEVFAAGTQQEFSSGSQQQFAAGRLAGFVWALQTVEPLTDVIAKQFGGNENLQEVRVYISKDVILTASNADFKPSKDLSTVMGRQVFSIKKGTRGKIVNADLTKGLLTVAFIAESNGDFPLQPLAFQLRQSGDTGKYFLLHKNSEQVSFGNTPFDVTYEGKDGPYLLLQLDATADDIRSVPGVQPYQKTGGEQ
ncbi:MAG: hypothetical protein LBR23_07025 [Spirochaetaceae bacterium]|jgi:hypothetical protein|nr:hypothetical protein [Spirochaetaceae bacterium]